MQFDLALAQQAIEEGIRNLDLEQEPANLYDPIRYFLSLGGKRLRPMLTMLSAAAYDVPLERALRPALAVEIFHNFTLVHDDIMDNAPLRRGLATVHEKWNRSIALLSGDLMLILAYEHLSGLGDKVLTKFNRCAIGVCQGQQLDMDFETMPYVSQSQYLHMIGLKTAVLLGFALELGADLGGADSTQSHLWQQTGYWAGVGFQLKDDLLDVYGEQARFGKQIGGDILSNKKTFLLIKALELANAEQLNTLRYWLSAVDFDPDEKINAVKTIYDQLGIAALTESLAESYFQKALDSLHQIHLTDKAPIFDFLHKLMQRTH